MGDMQEVRALVVTDGFRELTVEAVKAQVQKIQTIMKELMREDEHYGASFPGDKKKNLLKPGADKLCFMFRLRPELQQETKELPGGHREVRTVCRLIHIDSGTEISQGIGTCSTMESKYRWRYSAKKCPSCGAEAIGRSKEEWGGGYYCNAKKGGCGKSFKPESEGWAAIEAQTIGKIENPDIADTYNTVLKISTKRAYVAATITGTAASDIFSQDAEDFVHDGPEENIPTEQVEKKPEKKAQAIPEQPFDMSAFAKAVQGLPKDKATALRVKMGKAKNDAERWAILQETGKVEPPEEQPKQEKPTHQNPPSEPDDVPLTKTQEALLKNIPEPDRSILRQQIQKTDPVDMEDMLAGIRQQYGLEELF